MILAKEDFEKLSRIRVAHCKKTKKDSFKNFSLGQKKATTNVHCDPLSHEERAVVNEAKDRLTYREENYSKEVWDE